MKEYQTHINWAGITSDKIKKIYEKQFNEPAPLVSNEYYVEAVALNEPGSRFADFDPHLHPEFSEELKDTNSSIVRQYAINIDKLIYDKDRFIDEKSKNYAIDNYIEDLYIRKKNIALALGLQNPEKQISRDEAWQEILHRKGEFAYAICRGIAKELQEKYGLYGSIIIHSNNAFDPPKRETLFACFPSEIRKNSRGEWFEEIKEKSEAQFFGLIIARGLVAPESVMKTGIIKGPSYHETLAVLKQLKDEKVEPLLSSPIIPIPSQQIHL